jgi:hypothetical protein
MAGYRQQGADFGKFIEDNLDGRQSFLGIVCCFYMQGNKEYAFVTSYLGNKWDNYSNLD